MSGESELFRREVAEMRSARLHGDVLVTQTFSTGALTLLLTAVVLGGIAWATFGHFARIEPVRGVLLPDQGYSKIYAPRPGTVTQLLVHGGDSIKAGQRLAVIEVESPGADGVSAGGEEIVSIGNQMDLAERQVSISGKRASQEYLRLSAAISGLNRQDLKVSEQVILQKNIVSSIRQNLDEISSVVDKGFISRLEFDRRKQNLLTAQQDLSKLLQERDSIAAEESKTANERDQIKLANATENANAKTTLESLRQQRSRTKSERSYSIVSRVSGRVAMIQVDNGRPVQNQTPIMIIVPDKSVLRATLYVPSRAIGLVKRGAKVRLMYDAFPYQRYGSFIAYIDDISGFAIAGSETDAPFAIDEPVYRVTARIDDQSVIDDGSKLKLQAGMTLVANMVLEQHSFIEWLLGPLHSITRRT